MCGIVGIVDGKPVARDLIGALGRMEYRGYDSAGVALANPGMIVHKVVGRPADLTAALGGHDILGQCGIAHTRWATHGKPEARNAHPHVCEGIAAVHNGIIENHATLRAELAMRGHVFHSDTDSEVVPHLIAMARRQGRGHGDAVRQACSVLRGAYAIAVLFADAPDRIFVARLGSPLLVGDGAGMAAVASDVLALDGICTRFTALSDGDLAEISASGVRIVDRAGASVTPEWEKVQEAEDDTEFECRYELHTRREIAQQPAALRRTDAALLGRSVPPSIAAAQRLVLVGCGSSLYAAGAARGTIERLTGIPCDIEIASEFRYRDAPISPGSVAVLVSQSGETADTLAAMALLKQRQVPIVAVVNVNQSSMARGADLTWPTDAGREQGVAATKSFTAQLSALLRLAVAVSKARGGDSRLRAEISAGLLAAPAACAETEQLEPVLADIADWIARENEALFIGRGAGAAIAGEAALKLKELSYIRADAYPAGELKHGPIALIRTGSPVIVFAGSDALLPKTLASVEEIRARGARVVACTDARGAAAFRNVADIVVELPGEGIAQLFAQAVAQQLLAYHTALALNCDVDRPRNLAKSVTVE